MAFPLVSSSEQSQEDTAVTTHDVTLPAGILVNELLLVFFGCDVADPSAWTAGWHQLLNSVTVGPNARLVVFFRYAAGGETTFQVTTPSAVQSCHVAYRIGCNQRHAAPQWAGEAISSASSFGSPVLNPFGWGSEDVLWISAISSDGPPGFVSFPTNYTDNQHNVFNTDTRLDVSTRELTASSEDPGNYTLDAATNIAAATIAIRPVQATAAPTFVGKGDVDASTAAGSVSPALPQGIMPDDINILMMESEDVAMPTQAGYAQVAGSPVVVAGVTRLHVWWKRYVAGDALDPFNGVDDLTGGGGHVIAQFASFRGCPTSGDPWDVTEAGTEAVDDTSVSIPGDTTTVAGCLVLAISSTSADVLSSAEFSAWSNADLTVAEEIMDEVTTHGNGGGFGVAIGEKSASGAYGATTATLVTAAQKAMLSVALKPDTSLVSPDCERLLFGQIIRHH